MKNIIVLFSGTASNLENILNTIDANNIKVVATFTNNKKARGISISEKFDVPCSIVDEREIANKEIYNEILIDKILKIDFDLVVLAGYMRIVPRVFIDKIEKPIINIHPSLLPLHKGLDGAQKSYNDSNQYGGVSVHYVVPEVDSGEIIIQKTIDKSKVSNFEEYKTELSKCEFEIFPIAIYKALGL